MPKLHISQDETGYWQLSLEGDDGTLSLLSHHFPSAEHLIQDARELVEDGKVPDGVIVIGPAKAPAAETLAAKTTPYKKPAPRRAVD
jgi:hypothetical protein